MSEPLTWKLDELVSKLVKAEREVAACIADPTKNIAPLEAALKKARTVRRAYHRQVELIYEALEKK